LSEKLVTANTCRRAELADYIVYFGADFGEKILQNASKAEEEKLYHQRNFGALVLLELGKLACNLIKFSVNQDLCNPIGTL
jgi:hypothetical protein